MAGTSSTFNAARFRAAIRQVMQMGTPPDSTDALAFYWNPVEMVTGAKDGEGVPFDPAAPVSRVHPAPVTVPCAIEYVDATGQPTPFGSVLPSKLKVTLLDEDYQAVKDCDYTVMRGERYLRHHTPPVVGLFTVGVHTIIFVAENER